MRLPDACRASILTKKVLDDCGYLRQSLEKEVANGTGGRKIRPLAQSTIIRSVGIPNFEPLLDSYQAGRLLDMHHKTLRNLTRRDEIHGSYVGKLCRFRAADLNVWLETKQRAN
jgi:hypothetical protein